MPFAPHDIVPRRIFLDTCTFQAVADCGESVFDGGRVPRIEDYAAGRAPQVVRRPDGPEILGSLKAIFAFNDRAQFDWIVSPASLAEIDDARDNSWSRYARDVMDHSGICLSENPPDALAGQLAEIIAAPGFGSFSAKDRALLMEAVASDCDHFLTIEKRLPKQAPFLLQRIPLLICSPQDLWNKLLPHVGGL